MLPPGTPRIWGVYGPYFLILWGIYCALRIAQLVYDPPAWHGRIALGLTLATQAALLWALPNLELTGRHPSITRAAAGGDLVARVFVGVLVCFGTLSAAYMARTFLWLARREPHPLARKGERLAAVGLIVLLLDVGEELAYLLGLVPRSWHSRLVLALIALGGTMVALGTLLFSRQARQVSAELRLRWLYARVRPLGQAIAHTWPNFCLGEYAWWTLLDVPRARQRLYRIVMEWMDLRRRLVAYLPDENIPQGTLELEAETQFLALGLQPDLLNPRKSAGDPDRLPPVPEELEQAGLFLLQVRERLGARLSTRSYGMLVPNGE